MKSIRRSVWAWAALLAVGCGGEGGGGGSADSGPGSQSVFLVQRSASAANAITSILEAANEGILAANPNGGSPAPGPKPVPVFPGATPSFDFAAAIDETFDLDAEDADGNDRFPDATGSFHVTATGTETGDPSAGDATFLATVEVDADIETTDPDTGVITTIPAGATWSYLLSVEWTMTDDENWEVTATATTTIDVQDVTVDDGVTVVTVDVVGDREVISSRARTNKHPSHFRSFTGSLSTTVDDGETVETVEFEFTKPGHVSISVLSVKFSSLSEGQLLAVFRTAIN